MAGLIGVAVLPKKIGTVDEALDLLATLPSHAFISAGKKPRVLHASDLLHARRDKITLISEVEGRRVARVPVAKLAPMGASDDADDIRSVFESGNADKVFGPVFKQTHTDFLLTEIDGDSATLITRSERFEAALSQAACECNGPGRHTRDGQKSDTGKNCATIGCPGTYTCF